MRHANSFLRELPLAVKLRRCPWGPAAGVVNSQDIQKIKDQQSCLHQHQTLQKTLRKALSLLLGQLPARFTGISALPTRTTDGGDQQQAVGVRGEFAGGEAQRSVGG